MWRVLFSVARPFINCYKITQPGQFVSEVRHLRQHTQKWSVPHESYWLRFWVLMYCLSTIRISGSFKHSLDSFVSLVCCSGEAWPGPWCQLIGGQLCVEASDWSGTDGSGQITSTITGPVNSGHRTLLLRGIDHSLTRVKTLSIHECQCQVQRNIFKAYP